MLSGFARRNTVIVYAYLSWASLALGADPTSLEANNLQAGPTSITPSLVQENVPNIRWSYDNSIVDAKVYGADPTGVADSATAINNAIASLPSGGIVFLPAGMYKVNSEISMGDKKRLVGVGTDASILIPGTDNINVIHHHGSFGGVSNLTISNIHGKKGISALRITPLDETQIATRVDQNFNFYENIKILYCSEGIVMMAGPDIKGADSGCWYNTFLHINIFYTTRGVWLKDSITASGSGVNRNNFFSLRVGNTGTNTGIQIDAGDTNKFFGYSAEGIATGTFPNSTPTGIKIIRFAPKSGVENVYNQFYGAVFEANTRDIDDVGSVLQIIGYYNRYTTRASSSLPRIVGDQMVKTKSVVIDGSDTHATLSFSYGDTATNWGVIKSSAGVSGNYNGIFIAANDNTSGDQANTSLPSWALDIGGVDNFKYRGDADSITFLRRSARGAWVPLVRIKNNGDVKIITPGKGIILTTAAGNVTKRVRLNDIGDGLIFENE